ncbi:GNAT family N-acetyltransferase [Kushneria marisflavi]|uniref:Uncharacterized protein n=1 Tax=Kushneria marisflavi TaxID=157779 RepID=A0A240US14_9GAMM|nr:GNAT family N-acetyltransferase [Kushneria marisflavi]ART63810.1 hypothetical protein B9H00_12735 [Kushneria marisflavi]RKD85511.1 spermine/spermidine N-acetyltransferase [Kushneria marisflavi]
MAVVFKTCGPADALKVADIGRETYRQTFEGLYAPEVMTQYLDRAFAPDVVAGELEQPKSAFWLLEVDDQVAGYLKMNQGDAQTESQEEDGIEIERIYLLKAFQGRGLGRRLFDRAIAFARSSGSHFVWLGVWENNHQAIGFYTSMGFEITGTHDFHMGEVVDTDYIMRLTL